MKKKNNIICILMVVALASVIGGCSEKKQQRQAIPAGPWAKYDVQFGVVTDVTDCFGKVEKGNFLRLYCRLRVDDDFTRSGADNKLYVLLIDFPTGQQAQDFLAAAQGRFVSLLDPSEEDRYEVRRTGRVYRPTDWGGFEDYSKSDRYRIVRVHNSYNIQLGGLAQIPDWVKPTIYRCEGKDLLREDVHGGDAHLFKDSLKVRKKWQEEAAARGEPVPAEP